ncbi:hypothetical protein ACFQZZ_14555 [Nocardia sp. GCM10030253]|uniref:hypothetical protein n=1 Tax=Nocardia sp. GCM10030253 TaxID=3273404 RepID=UPI00362A2E2F
MTENTRTERAAERHEVESETEQQFRADFMHAWSSITRDPEGHAPAAVIDYAEYSNPWLSQQDWSHEWAYLSTAAHRWQRNPNRATRALDVNRRTLSPIRQRSEEQARYLAEHGIERDEAGLLTSHYVTRVEDRAESGTVEDLTHRPVGTAITFIAPDGGWNGGWHAGHDSDAQAAEWAHEVVRTARLDVESETVVHVSVDSYDSAGNLCSSIFKCDDVRANALAYISDWDDAITARDAAHDVERVAGMPWANEAEIGTSAPVPVSSTFAATRTRDLAGSPSPLAEYKPGNALATSMANIERDGAER